MGELIRRLEYERRSRSLMTNSGSPDISREYSTSVRSANAMEERKRDLYVQRNELHMRLFLNRHEYETKVVESFKSDLDFKTQNFKEEKFQNIRRAQSAFARLNGRRGKKKKSRPVSEILPRKYYKDNKSEIDDTKVNTETEARGKTVKLMEEDQSNDDCSVKKGKDKTMTFEEKVKEKLINNTRRMSYAAPSLKPQSADVRKQRRQSMPDRCMTAYIPRDVKPRIRGSSESIDPKDSDEMLKTLDQNATASRSFRLLKEAFKKVRIEQKDPQKERFESIKVDHKKQMKILQERTMKRFNDIFDGQVFAIL